MKRKPEPHVTATMEKDLLDAIPSSWLDPPLSSKTGLGMPPYYCPDVERLLNGIRADLKRRIAKYRRVSDE